MKKIIILFLFVLSTAGLFAQECTSYFPVKIGSTWEMAHYGKKDKLEGTTSSQISAFEDTETGYIATISMISTDEKSKETVNAELYVKCENGIIFYDMRNFLPAGAYDENEVDMSVVSSDLQYPAIVEAGQTLPDANINFTINSGGFSMEFRTEITNRKVIGKETIECPAGTFEVWKISYTIESKSGMMNSKHTGIEYISIGNGVIKTETYNEKGVLQGYSILTKIAVE